MYSRNIQELIDRHALMPLDAGVRDASSAAALDAPMLERIFGVVVIRDNTSARLCLAGLRLLAGDLDGCHELAQAVRTPDGSCWHAIMHRREGDFANSVYWYRRAGEHGIFAPLREQAVAFAGDDPGLRALAELPAWNPAGFVACCRAALEGKGDADACRRIQQAEWNLLFDWCYRKAAAES